MYYTHQYFSIDLEGKKVFDENNKILQLTGNAYRMLVFLCEKRNATITDIGSHLDWAKEYDENHLRQYRYKIETIIGKKIIEYKNGIYSLIGDTEKIEQLAKPERNTSLLHPERVKYAHNLLSKSMSKKTKLISVGLLSVFIISISIFLYRMFGYAVKKSSDDICHARGTTYYYRTKNFISYKNLDDCLQSGGRLPKN